MVRLFFVLLLWSALLFGTDTGKYAQKNEQNTPTLQQKVLYLSYVEVPKRVIKGEVFSITVKTFTVIEDFEDIEYTLSKSSGIEILNDGIPYRKTIEHAFLDTFYFKAVSGDIRLPDITATLKDSFGTIYPPVTLKAQSVDTVTLNPRANYCNIVAKDFTLNRYKTTPYDATHNIVVFSASAKQTLLRDFYLPNIALQGFESLKDTIESSKMIYYAVIDAKKENLLFSYFNTLKNDYIDLDIPIIVDDDRVSTQSDLTPKDNSKKRLKLFIAAGIVFFGVVMLLLRQRYGYIIFIVIPAIYIVMLLLPEKRVCVRPQTKIRILPLENGTIFEVTDKKMFLQKKGETKGFVKVELSNKKIGWVKDEDICTH